MGLSLVSQCAGSTFRTTHRQLRFAKIGETENRIKRILEETTRFRIENGGNCPLSMKVPGKWEILDLDFDEDLYGVWGRGPEHFFAVGGNLRVGDQSKVCEFADGKTRIRDSGIQSLVLSVCGNATGVVRAVGFNGGIVEKRGGPFVGIGAETNDHLFAVQNRGQSGWIVGGLNGTLREWDGNSWSHLDVTRSHINGIAVFDDDTAILVTHTGDMVERRAGAWHAAELQQSGTLHGVAICTKTEAAFACAANGTILRRGPLGDWRPESCPTDRTLFSICVAENTATAVGASGIILSV